MLPLSWMGFYPYVHSRRLPVLTPGPALAGMPARTVQTTPLYAESGVLTRHLANAASFPKDRNHIISDDQGSNYGPKRISFWGAIHVSESNVQVQPPLGGERST